MGGQSKYSILIDILISGSVFMASYWFRLSGDVFIYLYFLDAAVILLVLLLVRFLSFTSFGIYKSVFQFAHKRSYRIIISASTISSLVIIIFNQMNKDILLSIPKSILIMEWILSTIAFLIWRFFTRQKAYLLDA